jgi:hypothetical protein
VTSQDALVRNIHYVCAASLFLVLSYFSLVLFTKTKAGSAPTPEKRIRNRVYATCGVIMLVCIAALPVYYAFLQGSEAIAAIRPVFWLESLALWAFGVSWLTKGQTLWMDAAPAG